MIRTTTPVLVAGVLLAALLLDAPGLVAVMAACGVLLALLAHADGGSAIDGPLALALAVLAVSWWWSPLAGTSLWPYAAWLLTAAGVARAARASHVYRFLVAGLVGGGATLLGYSALIRLTTQGGERLIVYPAIAHWGQYPELGIVAVIVVPMAAAVLLGAQAPATRASAALLLAVSVVGLALTSSRAAWVASAIALLPLAAAGRRRLAAVLIGVAVVGGLVGMQAEAARRVATKVSAATDTRGEAWVHALDLWRERPLVGWGPGAYRTAHTKVFGPSNAPAASSAHNLPLQIGVEFGLLGLLAFSWLALRVCERAVTIVRAPRPAGLDGLLALGVSGTLAGLTARLLVDVVDPVGRSQRVCFEVAIVVGLMAASSFHRAAVHRGGTATPLQTRALRRLLSPRASLAACFGVVGFGLAQPMFEWARQQADYLPLGIAGTVGLVVALHVGPALGLWVARQHAGAWRPALDITLGMGVLTSVALQVRSAVSHRSLLVPDAWSGLLIASAALMAVFAYRRARPQAALFAAYAGILSVVFPVQAVWHSQGAQPWSPATTTRTDTVIVVVLDELSLDPLLDDRGLIDQTRFPAFAALAQDGLWFRQAIANYSATAFGVPASLTGTLLPSTDEGGALQAMGSSSLFVDLIARGYQVNYLSSYLPCPPRVSCVRYDTEPLRLAWPSRVGLLLAHGYLAYSSPSSRWYPWMPARVRRAEADLLAALPASRLAGPGQATWAHLLLPHDPYVLDRNGRTEGTTHGRFHAGANLEQTYRRYVEQLIWVDRQLGRFLLELDRRGRRDSTTVVVTSDHGTCWTSDCRGRIDVRAVAPSLARIPMFVRGPWVSRAVSDADYQQVDLRATVLKALRLAPGSAATPSLTERPRRFFPDQSGVAVELGPVATVPVN